VRLSNLTVAFFVTVFILSLASILFSQSDFIAALYLAGFSIFIVALLLTPKRNYEAY
jgi:hypothetical protein